MGYHCGCLELDHSHDDSDEDEGYLELHNQDSGLNSYVSVLIDEGEKCNWRWSSSLSGLNLTILNDITSFAISAEQARDLRLVCRRFDASALKQLRTKLLNETKLIGFMREYLFVLVVSRPLFNVVSAARVIV